MSPLFTINFRREAYAQEVSRRRRRLAALGGWVAYFGALAVLMGLYGLNGVALARRARLLERQTALVRNAKDPMLGAQLAPFELGRVESMARSARQWRDRLERLGELLPPDARLTGLSVNPQNMSDAASRNLLVVTGELRNAPGQDRMQGVMKLIAALRSDSTFASGYRNIRLATTRVGEDGSVEFQVECR